MESGLRTRISNSSGEDFSAPIAWPLLGRLGLTPLRQVTVIEELIPGTQVIPTMTLAWLAARIIRRG